MIRIRLRRACRPWTAGALLLVGAACLPQAALPLSGQSAEAPPPARSVADGVYSDEQAARGEATFQQNCAACHTPSEFRGDAFVSRWATLGSLFELVSTTMPQDFPGGLSAEQYADVLAAFLRANEFPAGAEDLPADAEALGAIRIQPRR